MYMWLYVYCTSKQDRNLQLVIAITCSYARDQLVLSQACCHHYKGYQYVQYRLPLIGNKEISNLQAITVT